MKKLLIIFVGIFSIAACSKQEPVQTVDYYIAHPDEMRVTLQHCKNLSLDEVSKDENCTNAEKAERRLLNLENAAKADIQSILAALRLYKFDNKAYPSNKQGLKVLVGKYLEKLPQDPWGNEYQYQNPGKHSEIDVYSYGSKGNDKSIIGNW